MHRRSFLTLLGGASAAWPLAAGAQQKGLTTIGLLHVTSEREALGAFSRTFPQLRRGLAEGGYVEGRNLTIEYRWGEGRVDRLPELAADLVRARVAVIITVGGSLSALAAKAASTTIPIVFGGIDDPVQAGVVTSYNHPDGNITGITAMTGELSPKRLELLHELAPSAASIALLSGGAPANREPSLLRDASAKLGLSLSVLNATSGAEIETAFTDIERQRLGALMVGSDAILIPHASLIVALAQRAVIPSMFHRREYVDAGGLASYGADIPEVYRQVGLYATRILNGEKPGDLPIAQPTRFEFVLNLKTARALGLEIPLKLHAFADDIVE